MRRLAESWPWVARLALDPVNHRMATSTSNTSVAHPNPGGAVPQLLWVQVMSLLLRCAFFSTSCTTSLSQPPAPCIMQAFCSVSLARFQLFVLPYVYFRRQSGEDIFTPIKLINCQRERDTVLVTGITVHLLTWHREGKGKGW